MSRAAVRLTLAAAIAALAGCATPPPPPPPVAVAPPPPPPPTLPAGGYLGMANAVKRPDGRYVTPNIDMTPAAAVWHLREALNVAALGCAQAGGGTVDPYNAWLTGHAAALDAAMKQYLHEWEVTGWSDWRDSYDDAQTRLYNFYSQPAIRRAFCAVARDELAAIGTVPDATLADHARGALARLDKPFIDFFGAFDAWRDYYAPKVEAPPVFVPLAAAEGAVAAEAPPVFVDAPAARDVPAAPAPAPVVSAPPPAAAPTAPAPTPPSVPSPVPAQAAPN